MRGNPAFLFIAGIPIVAAPRSVTSVTDEYEVLEEIKRLLLLRRVDYSNDALTNALIEARPDGPQPKAFITDFNKDH